MLILYQSAYFFNKTLKLSYLLHPHSLPE